MLSSYFHLFAYLHFGYMHTLFVWCIILIVAVGIEFLNAIDRIFIMLHLEMCALYFAYDANHLAIGTI